MSGIDADALAQIVCDRFNDVLPAATDLRPTRMGIAFFHDGEFHQEVAFAEMLTDAEDADVERVLWNLLDAVQDFMIEVVGPNTWPGAHGGAPREVRADAEEIVLWYGDEAAPDLRLEPIPLSAIRRRDSEDG